MSLKRINKAAVPVVPAKRGIQVTAPSNLPEGYKLPVAVGNQIYNVTVVSAVFLFFCYYIVLTTKLLFYVHIANGHSRKEE